MKKVKNTSTLNLGITFLLLIVFVAVWSGTASGISKKKLTRTDKQGAVTVIAVFMNPRDKKVSSDLRFDIKLDTHSVDLDQYNLQKLSTLRFDNGIERKSNGLNKKGSGHHISNVLTFPGPLPDDAKSMVLVVRDVDGVAERLLEWKLPIK